MDSAYVVSAVKFRRELVRSLLLEHLEQGLGIDDLGKQLSAIVTEIRRTINNPDYSVRADLDFMLTAEAFPLHTLVHPAGGASQTATSATLPTATKVQLIKTPCKAKKVDEVKLRKEILSLIVLENTDPKTDQVEISVSDFWLAFRESVESAKSITLSTVRDCLQALKKHPGLTQYDITVPAPTSEKGEKSEGKKTPVQFKNPVVIRKDFTIHDGRSEILPRTKERIGAALWHVLFGMKVGVWPEKNQWRCDDKYLLPDTKKKISALSARSNLSILVDAGSSTTAAVNALLTLKTAPFWASESPANEPKRTRLMRLQLTTNSLSIADIISKSNRPLRSNLPIRIIGGDWRVESGSIAGPLAEHCLQKWNFRTDLAIIGTTGVAWNETGPYFSCDDILEAHVKAAFLDMAALRVVLLDHTKLNQPPHQFFAAVASSQVDLVLLDFGLDAAAGDIRKRFDEFSAEANQNGVSVVGVETSPDEIAKQKHS